MLKKRTIAASIICIILSIIAFTFNFFVGYIFLIVGAFGGLSKSSNLLNVDLIIFTAYTLIILAIVSFVFSIVVVVKTKKSENLSKLKKILVAYIIVVCLIALINIFIGFVILQSVAGWFYILFAIFYILLAGLVVTDVIKNSKLEATDKS